MVLQSVYSYTI